MPLLFKVEDGQLPILPHMHLRPCLHSLVIFNKYRPKFPISMLNNSFTIVVMKAPPSPPLSIQTSGGKKEIYEKIPFSNVVVKRRKRAYWIRKWNVMDLYNALSLLSMHVLCLFAPFNFTWPAFGVLGILTVATGLFGIGLCYHRFLSHQSFKLPKWLEYFFAYLGVQALQGDPIRWVSRHRSHHTYTDKERDPHSPIEGFWFSHIFWMLDTDYAIQKVGKGNNVEDLRKQWYYRFLENTYIFHIIASVVLLYTLGGFPFVIWGLGVRGVYFYHATWLVNSACHIWGHQAWNTGDLSQNNWFVALLVFGEGWHNNHHAFEYSARHGLEWWQLDTTWLAIKMLAFLGLAKDVKVPSDIQKKKLSFKN